jgi:hypothetical protein
MTSSERPGDGETYGELLARNHLADAVAIGSWRPPPFDAPHALLTFGAQFAEVAVDPEFGLVRVRRPLLAFAYVFSWIGAFIGLTAYERVFGPHRVPAKPIGFRLEYQSTSRNGFDVGRGPGRRRARLHYFGRRVT